MRLWHQELIPHLPRQQLLGQHRECCALRGRGWGRKHATVDYVFRYSRTHLVAYHLRVMDEMRRRGYNVAPEWRRPEYRGKALPAGQPLGVVRDAWWLRGGNIYPEHDEAYLSACRDNLSAKGVTV